MARWPGLFRSVPSVISDEVVGAQRTPVVIHPLADDRQVLPMEGSGEAGRGGTGFCLAMSYNPGYQSVLRT